MFSARWILPVSSPPINGGWVRLRGNEIIELGQGRAPVDANDLGDVAILPGLVNAHTHLEFSDCTEPIGESGVVLNDWIGQVIHARGATTAESKRAAIDMGLRESVNAGVRLIGEITTTPCEYPDAAVDLIAFAEVLGLSKERSEERFAAALAHNSHNTNGGWSPHAPYSTSREMIGDCIAEACCQNRMVAMHVAESPGERELLESGTGPFAETLRAIGVWQQDLFPWGSDPTGQLLQQLSKAPRALVVHGNDLLADEIGVMADQPQMTVVYCPRTHAFFQHRPHPVLAMHDAGVRVALGTDSRASNPDLCIWGEVQHLLNHRQDIEPNQVVAMATLHGADAFGRRDLGRLEVGCQPGLVSVATNAADQPGLYRDLASSDGCRPVG